MSSAGVQPSGCLLPAILDVMSNCADLPPIVWKSDFYGTPEAFDLLDGVVAVYVADFKFGNDDCADRIARVKNYTAIVTRNLKIVAEQSDLIVRHLLLPGHFDYCFRPIVEGDSREPLLHAARGLTLKEAENVFAKTLVLDGKLDSELSEKTARVFVIATANEIIHLPPNFLEKGGWTRSSSSIYH